MFSRQRKRRNLAIRDPMQPEHIATHTAPLSAFSSFHWRSIFRKIKVLHIEYSTFKIFSAGRHTRQYKFWIKCDKSATYKSTVAFLPHLIELNSTRQKCDVWTGPESHIRFLALKKKRKKKIIRKENILRVKYTAMLHTKTSNKIYVQRTNSNFGLHKNGDNEVNIGFDNRNKYISY